MEPLTTIELASCEWLGILALACVLAAEFWNAGDAPKADRATFAGRELTRRAASRRTNAR